MSTKLTDSIMVDKRQYLGFARHDDVFGKCMISLQLLVQESRCFCFCFRSFEKDLFLFM